MSLFGPDVASTATRTWTVLRPVDPEVMQRMLLYESKSAYYLLGYYGDETHCRLLTFPKQLPQNQNRLVVMEDERTYTPEQAQNYFQPIHADPNQGLKLLCEAFGILGCFRFLEGYYLLLLTKRRALGSLAGHTVYGIADTTLVPLSGSHDSWAERRYRKLMLSGVDLTKDFFYSYTYNICYTVQHNLTQQESVDPFDCIFVWNAYLTRDLRTALPDNKWVLPLVHGSWQQRNLSIFGKIVHLTLVSRRSRRFAGTRYLKRGINQLGWVANEVETEQIVSLQNLSQSGVPSLASVVQIRGSIPLFWGQATSALNPRPSIQLYNIDPLFDATRKHFHDLFQRYGGPVVVLNLVKRKERHPRETILRKEFGRAIDFLNQRGVFDDDVIYYAWDFKADMHKNGRSFVKSTEQNMQYCVERTGFCAVNPTLPRSRNVDCRMQTGVMRSNCIDCLDRTNVSQYLFGVVALGYQLCFLGLLATNEIDPDCSMAYELMQMYEIMGNELALQYGGSEAHGTFFERMRGTSKTASQSKELLRSIKRYYSNAVSDPEKQDAINLFLGHFVPQHDKADVWELESDYLLHCGVDWEKQNLMFSLQSDPASNPSPSQPQTQENTAHKSGKLEFFPVPVISQAGGPEEPISSDQATKKDAGQSGWSLNFWFRSLKEPTTFQLPDAKGPLLDSFEEMLSINPITEVRLHDGENRRQKDGQRIEFQRTLERLLTQETTIEQGSGTLNVANGDILSDSCVGSQSQALSTTLKANSDIQVLHSRKSLTTMSDRPIRSKSKASQEFRSLQNHSTFGMVETSHRPMSDTQVRVHRRTWFGGLRRRSNEGRPSLEKRSASASAAALRTLLTPEDVEKYGLEQDSRSAIPARFDPVKEFWKEYWSITEQSLTTELTLAEKVSKASNKREAVRLARASKTRPSRTDVGKLTAVNMFLDKLLDQYLDESTTTGRQTRLPDRLTEDVTRKTQTPFEGVKSDGDASHQTALDVRSNINELLFCSASGPGDRVLEKWFLADKQAEADYHRNLSWIMTPVEPSAFGPIKA